MAVLVRRDALLLAVITAHANVHALRGGKAVPVEVASAGRGVRETC